METKAEQYYPTYKAEKRDVLLLEFEEAQRIANGQSKIYGQVTSILLAIVAFSFTFILNKENVNAENSEAQTLILSNSILFCVVIFVFGAFLLRYFVDLQKQITINARKVITLRTLLGLDYGHIHLTLPNWRVEGATNPFAIKYFNGWLDFRTAPFWVITIFVNGIWFLVASNNFPILLIEWYFGNIVIVIVYLRVFRKNLNDRHETIYLNFVKTICSVLRIKLVDNFEYTLYRAKLAYIELDRLKIDYKALKDILVDIEDNTFYKNNGVVFKSLFRGFLSRFELFRKRFNLIENGGSTITMQLARTLFIPPKQSPYLRKIAEILLSLWLNAQFTKDEILKLYVASVRYEKGVSGLAAAINYFFGNIKEKKLSNEESFFLVERLSNISSTVDCERVSHLTTRTKVKIDINELEKVYNTQTQSKRLRKA